MTLSWVERVMARSLTPQRSQIRRVEQAHEIVAAAERLLVASGESFTISELVSEADIALQTFYRYFPTKDELLLAVLENVIAVACAELERSISAVDDPVEQLRLVVTSPLHRLRSGEYARGRTVTREHFRLHQIDPVAVADATRPFSDLVVRVLRCGQDSGAFRSSEPERDAALINALTRSIYHHYAFIEFDDDADALIDHFWRFCLAAVGGKVD